MTAIHWKTAVSADFNTASDWSNGHVPGAKDDAILDAAGAAFTVTASTAETVSSIQTSTNATLLVSAGTFTASSGTGAGANAGTIDIGDGATLSVGGTVANSGTLAIASTGSGNGTTLVIAKSTTLSGAGQVSLSDSHYNQVVGGASAATLTNFDNTIAGSGVIGSSTLTLVNQAAGVIEATGNSSLTLNTGTNTITNAGLIEANGAGGLIVDSAVANTGVLLAASSILTLQGADIIGGTVRSTGTGDIAANGATFDGRTGGITLQGTASIADGQTLTLEGAVTNNGTIAIASTGSGNGTTLAIAKSTTLTGGGQVTLTDSHYNQIIGGASGATLTNVDNIIAGSGVIGSSTLTLVNQTAGVIEATGNSSLTLNTGTNTITNAGLIEANGAGGLAIDSALSNTGTLLAHVGTLTLIGSLTNLSGSTLAGGTLEADANATLELPQNVKIATDSGTIVLSGAHSVIESFNTTSSTEVSVDSTLTTIAAGGTLELLAGRNWSTKAAMTSAGVLQLGGGTFTAKSLANSGLLTGFGTVTAPVTNNGTLSAQANKTLSLQGGALTNFVGGTLTGGTYVVGAGATLQLPDGDEITTLAATIDLAGQGAVLQAKDTGTGQPVGLEASLASITAAGVLEVLGGRGYTSANAIGDAGVIQLGGGTFASVTLTVQAGGTLIGFGAVSSPVTAVGSVVSAGGAIAFSGTGNVFSGALAGGEIDFVGGSDELAAGASLTAGTIGVSGGATLSLAANQTDSGALVLNGGTLALGGATLTLAGAGSSLSGVISGPGTLSGSGAVLSGLTIAGGSTVSLAGAVSQTGAVTVGDATAATLQIAAGAIYQIAGAFNLGHGKATTSTLKDAGTLIKSGAGTSVVSLATTDTGLIEAAGGTLEFTGKLSGPGMMKIDGGATLETTSNVAATLTAEFAGAGAVLAIKKPTKFAATISGFASGETIDLLAVKATGASLNGSDELVVVNGSKTVATLQLTGAYAGDTFSVVSDGHGGSNITVSSGAARAPAGFAAAMAAMGTQGSATPTWAPREPVEARLCILAARS